MDFLDLAKNRFSVRSFQPDPVLEEDLHYILEAGRIAPSAANYQPWKFIVIREPENVEQLHALYHREWFTQAPVVILVVADHDQSWHRADGKDHADIDAAIAADHITLAATDRGLGTCWICNFDKEKTIRHFGLPENLEPIAFLPLGYPVKKAEINRHQTQRKKFDEVVSYEKCSL